jgi:flagellin-like protein
MKNRGMPPLHLAAARKNKRGVSPIIATILLVAITVVIAAVLYVLVSGYLKGTGSAPLSINLQGLANGKCSTVKNNQPVAACNTGVASYYLSFSSVSASNGMTTSDFGFKILTPGGSTVSFINATLVWNGNSESTYTSTGGWSFGSVPVNASDNIVFFSAGSLIGSGDNIQAVGIGSASVSGGYSGL